MSGDEFIIRAAVASDWPGIWAVFGPIVAAGQTYTVPRDANGVDAQELWMEPGTQVFVAERGGVVVGSAKLRPNGLGPAAHVANASFIVDGAHAGGGIGRALGEHVLAMALAAGYRAMQFNAVVETNTRAVALWRSLGFEILTTVPEAYDHATEGLVGLHIMHRAL
ncbi:MAG: GNAT family N-acetyltransferase [Sporichthyaceae bacterium]